MRLSRLLAPAFGLLLVAGCAGQPSEQTTFVNRAKVHHPDALFDVARRGDVLRANDARTGQQKGVPVCPRLTDLSEIGSFQLASIASMQGSGKAEYSREPKNFGHELNLSAYRTLLDQDMGRARRDIDALRAHAEANAWLPREESFSAAGAVIEGMGTLLPAWQILRQTSVATDGDRALIDGWLGRVAVFTDTHPGENNAGAFRGANDMMLGLMLGDDARYQKGIAQGFTAQLRAMRPDGSFPMEADRGRKALENSSRNISLLVYAAQIGLSQGIDLYATEVDGKSLEDAVSFLLRADQDNALIDVYASANRNPSAGFEAFVPNAQVTPWGGSARGWVKLYTQRFPDSDLSEQLLERIDLGRRIFSDTAGGSVTCYASPV